jgi:PDZ domain-containing protein
MDISVPLPPPKSSQRHGSARLWCALPILTIGLMLPAMIVVASLAPVRLWQLAPGSVQTVSDRLEFDSQVEAIAKVFPSKNSIQFVTALGSKLSALDSVVGALDDDVDVQTFEDRFGSETPAVQRQVGAQSMTTSKQIAEYVAFNLLGYPVSFSYGDVIVQQLVCLDRPSARSACKVLEPGDVIVAINGTSTPTLKELVDVVSELEPGAEITVTVIPYMGEDREDRRVTLIQSPDDPSRTIVGFIPVDTRTVNLPFEVEIDTDSIGGPSAGLAFTLALLDELTPGDLFGGLHVVATGTVSEDGSVGAIGALAQKAVAVKMAGSDLFLVPSSQDDEEIQVARKALGSKTRLVLVDSVDEALRVLEGLGGSGLENATTDL